MELRPYQVEAVEQIVARRNLLLAMVMGSGKSVTSIAAIRKLRQQGEVTRGLIFAPKSVKYQWVREIGKADPRARVQVVDGDRRHRYAGYRKVPHCHYTILHYECLIHDWEYIKEHLSFDFIIADEVSALKGPTAKRTKRAKVLAKRCDVRLGLSGQPVENRPEELFSIMQFIDPDVLGSFELFDRTFIVRDHWGRPSRYRNLHLIQNRLGPAMFRRSRADIAQWLPELIEIEMPIVLDRSAQALHDLVKQDLLDAIDKALAAGIGGFDIASHYGQGAMTDSKTAMGEVMSRMLAMRMLSSHPSLLRSSADDFDDPLIKAGSEYASLLKEAGYLDKLPQDNTKLDALIETLVEILDEDPRHKVVVFSFFKGMIRMIGARLQKLNIGYTVLTGDIQNTAERNRRIERFNTDPRCRVFLSSDAGSYGVDLNQGSHLIHYDLPWSAGLLDQRSARIDRTSSAFGQISVIYMYGHNTIEERMYNMLKQKAKVARAFIDGEFERGGHLKLDLESLRHFLES